MKSIFGILLILFTLIMIRCEKSQRDCEENNYGILKVNFGSGTAVHSMVVTNPISQTVRVKTSNTGLMSDTLHLTPGAFVANISSLDLDGLVVDTETSSTLIIQCKETLITVDF